MKKLSGAEIFIESLNNEQVELVFGYPGGAVLPIFEEFRKSKIKFVMPYHEQVAIHAAGGYARSTGKAGVCVATSGPGGTNLVTGLATANMDSIPIVAFTGQVPMSAIGTDAFQEADIRGITAPITKHNYLVKDINDLAQTIKEAFYIAQTGRPGPVLIDIPKDILMQTAEFNYPDKVYLPGYNPTKKGHGLQIKKAAEAINTAKTPVIYAGGGVINSNGSQELRELANKSGIPVTTTMMGLGSFDSTSPLSLGMLGLHGTTQANKAIYNADLIIAVGARFDNRVTGKIDKFAPNAKIIHIDIDPAEIGKRLYIDIPIVGDVKFVLEELNQKINENEHPEWMQQINKWRDLHHQKAYQPKKGKLTHRQVMEEIYNVSPKNTIITTEVGQHQMWAAHYYKYTEARSFISSGGLGTMGFGFPAAIGAQLGNPDKKVIVIAGDGSFMMNMQDMATIAKQNLPINIAIFNNKQLGMIRQLQEVYQNKNYFSTCLRKDVSCPPDCSAGGENCPEEMIPDFVKLAEAFSNFNAIRIEKVEDIRPAIEEAVNSPKPYLLDFIMEEEETMFPMVVDGDSLDEMLLHKEEIK
ncbi:MULTISPECIES: biosynthetic-type acetolactate synthase large subunit [Halanaerobium]|jgi:acetolactate synthase-1/2/3 large subunit|uniref:Acetolactate synthase n=1 Tax=Halanaerobium congolense TaxID=54121 RepID=A0A1G6JY85_9FIRM|nr:MULTISPECIES: biosynthetic-type acetolactate synthase large subunit [Halanaerobium]KXS48489.1 MAG: Acetolactate synthase [Halanaerobium sp. T82-1]OEG63453.1 MAG: acetolactate synthase, large subunit, biosynthetic type [Halanaerobium sp. MDAL1]PTX16055.1 acetolactate synthase large subunit [Halanaerobium congolense]PUU90998.1 MAG: acetolactate synthase, large subunit, biosynthetic type [Halanaerobium sp.]PXV63648.1 acetolactate synthase large subunit [Halanaerobium congolense]